MIAASGRFDLPFTCVDSTGAATAPTGTPTGTLVKNGTDLGTTVTVTMTSAQGIASCTIPSDAAVGDRFYIRISAVVSGTTYVVAGPAETCDKTIDSRATQTSLDTLDDYVDSEVAAIKAKTDNLPSDPADQSLLEAAITSATSGLATQSSVNTIDDFLDTEIAAIKAKTDNLPASFPTNFSSLGINSSGHISRVTLADTVTTLTGHTAQTGDTFARIGLNGAGLTAIGDTRLANLDAAVSTRLASASYTAPLDAAGVRIAVGLASANLDTQIGDIPTNAELTSAINTGRTTAMTESYPALGAAPTLEQAMFVMLAHMNEAEISGTTKTINKLDGSTTAATFTLDSATEPTSITRAT